MLYLENIKEESEQFTTPKHFQKIKDINHEYRSNLAANVN